MSERSADEGGRPGRCSRPTNGGDICSIDQNSFDVDDPLGRPEVYRLMWAVDLDEPLLRGRDVVRLGRDRHDVKYVLPLVSRRRLWSM